MSRHVVAIAVVLCLSPAWLYGQTVRFTVNVASADVHKYPSIGSPVIAQAARGRVLDVRRELGSWVAIPWPGGDNGLAYLHVTTGSIARATTTTPPATRAASQSSPATQPQRTVPPRTDQTPQRPGTASANQVQVLVTPPPHNVGLGMRLGYSTMGVGASARGWRKDRLGFQLTVSHAGMTSTLVPEQLSSTEIEPSVMYAFRERVGDYIWMRPFLGSGVNFHHRSLKDQAGIETLSDSGLGFQALGGAEFAVSGMPKFALSTDVSYHTAGTEITGYDLGGVAFSVSGHWYFK